MPRIPVILNKQFAQDGMALEDRLDQLVEVLAQLLEETPSAVAPANSDATMTDLRSGDDGVIHVVGNKCP